MTPVFCCGAECRAAGTGTAAHLSVNTTQPTIDTTIFHPGGGLASFRWAAPVSVTASLFHTIAQNTVCARVYVYVSAYPSATMVICQSTNANGSAQVKMNSSGLIFARVVGSAADVSTGMTLALNTWYRIEWKADASGATTSMTVTIDGANSTSDSHAQTSANFTSCAFGANIGGLTGTAPTINWDDFVIAALADYPIGDGYIVGYRVGATSGTHLQTAGDFQNDASTNITNGDGSGAKLNETVADTTSFIKHPAIGTAGGYVEYIYAMPTDMVPRAVEQVVAVRNVSLTTANDEKSQLYDGTSAADAYALTTVGDATNLVYRSKQWASPPSGGAWTVAKFAALRIRWGFSTDVAPVPFISFTVLEADFPLPPLPYVNPMPPLIAQ